jgi:serine O-acetyltransferase
MNPHGQAAGADIRRYLPADRRSRFRSLVAVYLSLGLQSVLVYRLGRLLQARRGGALYWLLYLPAWCLYGLALILIRQGYDIRLSLSADIGPGLFIGHFAGINLVNCRLGAHCSIGQETTIGDARQSAGPQIGDNVWIGSHSNIVGPLKIGDGATIAVGAAVSTDVPPKALMIGNPARLISRCYDNSAFLGPS